MTFETWKWSPVATFKNWTNRSTLSFFDFLLFHLVNAGCNSLNLPPKVKQVKKFNFLQFKKVTIWLKTCFGTWNSRKLKKLWAISLVQLLKVATWDHFQDSKVKIWLKHPGLLLVSFYASGPFVNFSYSHHFLQQIWFESLVNQSFCWASVKNSWNRPFTRFTLVRKSTTRWHTKD